MDIYMKIEILSLSFLAGMALRALCRAAMEKRRHDPLLADHISQFTRK